MAEEILLIPPFWLSERAIRSIPGMASSIELATTRYPLRVFGSPSLLGGPDVAPTWEGAVQALDEYLGPDVHVIALADAGAVAIMALAGRPDRARTLALSGFTPPDETLRKIGLGGLADYSETVTRLTNQAWDISMLLEGADPDFVRNLQKQIESEVNWPYFREFGESWEGIDLVGAAPRVDVPCLVQETSISDDRTGFPEGELTRLLAGILTNFEVDRLPTWPLTLQEPRVGLELANSCLAFFERHSVSKTGGGA